MLIVGPEHVCDAGGREFKRPVEPKRVDQVELDRSRPAVAKSGLDNEPGRPVFQRVANLDVRLQQYAQPDAATAMPFDVLNILSLKGLNPTETSSLLSLSGCIERG